MHNPHKQYDDFEILDRKFVGHYGGGILVWWLVIEQEFPRGVWRPFIVDVDGITIKQWPTWAPFPGSQAAFLSSPIFETLLAGNRGGGKSEMLLLDFAKDVGRWGSNWRGILFRKQLGDLDEMVRKTETLF